MSAPSSLHEQRVAAIRDLAKLAGLVVGGSLGAGLIPDVVAHRRDGGLALVGDAKATESPGDAHTAARLLRYCDAIRSSRQSQDAAVRVVVCHHRGAPGWNLTLRRVANAAGLDVVAAGQSVVGACTVVWVDVTVAARRSNTLSVSSRRDDRRTTGGEPARDRPVLRRRRPVVGTARRGL